MSYLGTNKIGKMYLGSTEIAKAYLGSDLVYKKQPALPYDAEIEYLESTGTQYIDTGISCNADYTIYVEFNSAIGTEAIIGTRRSTRTKEHALVMASEGDVSYRSSNANTQTPSIALYDGYTASTWVSARCEREKLYIDNSLVAQISNWITFTSAIHYYLFGMCTNGSASNLGSKKIRAFKISNNGQMLLDMISVRVGTTGYMYDKVSNQLFGNRGTGNFVLGNDKN
jgi:hypothetical protein